MVDPAPAPDPAPVPVLSDAEAFLAREALENPVPSLEDAVKAAEAGRTRKVIGDRKTRTHSILAGAGFEQPDVGPLDLPDNMFQPRAKGMR